MTLTQTVNVPVNRKLTINIPNEMPIGPTILTFTPANIGNNGCPKRRLGTLEGRLSVVFADDFAMTDSEITLMV